MARSKWKGPFVDMKLFKGKKKKLKTTTSRCSEIIPSFVGMSFNVHNGKNFSKIEITKEMVGFKLGEFSPTRKKFSFKKKK